MYRCPKCHKYRGKRHGNTYTCTHCGHVWTWAALLEEDEARGLTLEPEARGA